MTLGLLYSALPAKYERAEMTEVVQLAQRMIDLADGDANKGNFIISSPLALAFTTRATASYCLGLPGWRDDLRHGLAMARSNYPMSDATVVTYSYSAAIPPGMLRPDDRAMGEIEDALRIAEQSGDDVAVAIARMTLGIALVHRWTNTERDRGRLVLAEVGEVFLRRGFFLADLPIVEVCLARERAQCGDRDGAIRPRAAVDDQFREGRLLGWSIPTTGVLVETLLDRGAEGDVVEAEAAIERLAEATIERLAERPTTVSLCARSGCCGCGLVWRGFTAAPRLLTRTSGIATATWPNRLASKGHIEWVEAMT